MNNTGKRIKKRKIFLIIFAVLLVGIIAIRIALPKIVLRVVNEKLQTIEGYEGHVNEIGISLFRGAYQIRGLELNKTGGKIPVPFFAVDVIDISVEWKALFKGSVVAEVEVDRPTVNFVKGPTKETSQTEIDKDWTKAVDDLIPLKLNRVEVRNGEVHYRDYHSNPKIDILAKELYVEALNLSNTNRNENILPSTITARAKAYDGNISINMKLNPLNRVPTFDMNAKMDNLNLVNLNSFLQAYGNFDVEKGSISIYAEAAAKDNIIKGYTKPIISDLDVVQWKKEDDTFVKKVWESVVEVAGWVFENKKEEQVATKITFQGKLDNPDVNVLTIVLQALRNAFIQALYPSLENTVNLATVGDKEEQEKSKLGKLFSKSEEEVKEKEYRKEERKKRREERKKEKD